MRVYIDFFLPLIMCLATQHVAGCQLFPSWLYNWLGAVALSRCSASPARAWWHTARLGPTLGICLCATHCSVPTSLNWGTVSWGLCWLFVSDKSPRSLTYEEKRLFWLTVWKSPVYDLFCLLHCFWVTRRRHIMVGVCTRADLVALQPREQREGRERSRFIW